MAESWREGEEVVERAKMEMERREVGGREGAEERRGVRGEQRRGGEWVCRMSGGIEEQVCLCTFWSLYVDLELLKVEEKEVREENFSTRRAGTPISPSELNSNHVPSPEDQLTDFFHSLWSTQAFLLQPSSPKRWLPPILRRLPLQDPQKQRTKSSSSISVGSSGDWMSRSRGAEEA